jgi:valyl-tRNA synthetase
VYTEETAKFYTFKYGPFEIGTARPETKFGDKYVVVHPNDERYAQYKHGETFEAEWINGPVTATIIKDEAADPSFGTGAMTITPWHSQVDFEIAERHGLDREQIIDFHGRLLPIAGEFAGLPIAEAREKIVAKLADKGLLVKKDENYVHNVAINDRGKGIIEPQIRLQWFVDVNKPVVEWKGKRCSLKEVLQSVIREKDIAIIPKQFDKTYFHWIDNLRDWCISRQIWWGHRIPAWYRTDTDGKTETYVGLTPPTDESEGWNEWEQDPDTLDTWFSSSLWTWSTLIDPALANDTNLSLNDLLQKSPDFQAYHPTSVLETGWDILFFWVARMILSTTYATGQVPFKTVYLHGLIRAEDGKKMSKSRPESIIDPLDVIPKYGTDALRMALIMGVSPGNDQNWGWGKIEANRNFCNKLWNMARYTEGVLGEDFTYTDAPQPASLADHWVLSKLQQSTEAIAQHLDHFRFSEAYDTLYHFVWDEVADWYIEASKTAPNREVLGYVLASILKAAHPFAPFVTETIWQTLAWTGDSLLMSNRWPKVHAGDRGATADFEELQAIATEARFIVRQLGLQGAKLYYTDAPLLEGNAALITRLSGLADVRKVEAGNGLHLTRTRYTCWIDIDARTAREYLGKLAEQQAAQERTIVQLQGRLNNAAYVHNAPKQLVKQTREQLKEAEAALERLTREQSRYGDLS